MSDATGRLHEERESLWLLTFAPAVWFTHFVLSYVTASVWCSKVAGPDGSLAGAHVAIAIFTAVALAAIGVVGVAGYRRHTYGGNASPPHDYDSAEDRHRFLGYATLLLAGLSAVATVYVGLSAFFFGTCR
jgi:hypothetical protein